MRLHGPINRKLELDPIPLVIYIDVIKNWVQKQDTLVTCPVSVCFPCGINSLPLGGGVCVEFSIAPVRCLYPTTVSEPWQRCVALLLYV